MINFKEKDLSGESVVKYLELKQQLVGLSDDDGKGNTKLLKSKMVDDFKNMQTQ